MIGPFLFRTISSSSSSSSSPSIPFAFHLVSNTTTTTPPPPSRLLVNLLLSFRRCFGSVVQWTKEDNKPMFMAPGNQTSPSYFMEL
jgi:hypothetical protein